MKQILEFIEKHKSFVKKLILVALFVIVNCFFNSPAVNAFFNSVFASDMASTVLSASASGLVFGALD